MIPFGGNSFCKKVRLEILWSIATNIGILTGFLLTKDWILMDEINDVLLQSEHANPYKFYESYI